MKTQLEYQKLEDEFRRLGHHLLGRTTWGRRHRSSILADVAADAFVHLVDLAAERGISIDDLAGRGERDEATQAIVEKAVSRAVNGQMRAMHTSDRSRKEILPFRPVSGEDEHEGKPFHEIAMSDMHEATTVDEYFADEAEDLDLAWVEDEELRGVALGLADGLTYEVIAERLGYYGTNKAARRSWTARRVEKLRVLGREVLT